MTRARCRKLCELFKVFNGGPMQGGNTYPNGYPVTTGRTIPSGLRRVEGRMYLRHNPGTKTAWLSVNGYTFEMDVAQFIQLGEDYDKCVLDLAAVEDGTTPGPAPPPPSSYMSVNQYDEE